MTDENTTNDDFEADPYDGMPPELVELLKALGEHGEPQPERRFNCDIRIHLTATTSTNTGATNESIKEDMTRALTNYFASNIEPDAPYTTAYNLDLSVEVTDAEDELAETDAA